MRSLTRQPERQRGLGLIELMIAVTIGLVLIAGALAMFVNSRAAYNTNQEVARLLENGNYALDEIGRSLKMAGYWGRNNEATLVRGRTGDPAGELWRTTAATNDCVDGWYTNLDRRVEGLNDDNAAYRTRCLPDARYLQGDVLVVRHVEPSPVPTASLAANTTYIRSDPTGSALFIGTTEPTGFDVSAQNYLLRAEAIYVSPFNLVLGDGLPTLKRAALTAGAAGPEVFVPLVPSADEIIIPGIENIQVQFGVDTDAVADGSANQYVDANNVGAAQWNNVVSVRVWLLARAEQADANFCNRSTYVLAGTAITPAGPAACDDADPTNDDAFRRVLLTRTFKLRN